MNKVMTIDDSIPFDLDRFAGFARPLGLAGCWLEIARTRPSLCVVGL
jgi:hypothetical protein